MLFEKNPLKNGYFFLPIWPLKTGMGFEAQTPQPVQTKSEYPLPWAVGYILQLYHKTTLWVYTNIRKLFVEIDTTTVHLPSKYINKPTKLSKIKLQVNHLTLRTWSLIMVCNFNLRCGATYPAWMDNKQTINLLKLLCVIYAQQIWYESLYCFKAAIADRVFLQLHPRYRVSIFG